MITASDQTRIEQQDQASQARFFDASADGAFGMLPRFADPEYMRGYAHGLQSLPTNDKGEIIYSAIYCNTTEF